MSSTSRSESLNAVAASATIHCLAGCSVGEVLGMVITTGFGLAAAPSIGISIILAFVFGYSLSILPLRRQRLSWRTVFALALAADTASIAVMELADNGFVLAVPGAINAGLTTWLFWWSLLVSLVVAFTVAFPLNRWLIARGKGHAVLHHHGEE